MPATNLFYSLGQGQAAHALGGFPIDFDNDTIRIGLITSALAPDVTTHTHWSQLNANQVSGTGYTADGLTVQTPTVTRQAGSAVTVFDHADVVIAQDAGGFSNARHVVLFKWTGSAATSPLIATTDLGVDRGNVSNALTLQVDPAGRITWTMNA